jgi:hypothetical protein
MLKYTSSIFKYLSFFSIKKYLKMEKECSNIRELIVKTHIARLTHVCASQFFLCDQRVTCDIVCSHCFL